jgi:hypothetical protein
VPEDSKEGQSPEFRQKELAQPIIPSILRKTNKISEGLERSAI